ncbi:MAG: hypothetical protein JXJ04_15240 [Spirochaetales bacterium]|nr:hypothetical protein [Spirochaetales bacterium]
MRSIIIGCFLLLCLTGNADIFSVQVTKLIASSTLPDLSYKTFPYDQRHIRYSADKIFDNNPETAWSENVEGPGIGETISLELEREIKVDSVDFMAGYFIDGFYKKNNRIRSLTLQIPGVRDIHLSLRDKMQKQSFRLPENISFSKITIRIDSVYKGDKWDDTCLAEMTFSYLSNTFALQCPRITFKDNKYVLPAMEPLKILIVRDDNPIAYFSLERDNNLTGILGPGHQMGRSLDFSSWEFDDTKGIFHLSYSYFGGTGKPMGPEDPGPPELINDSVQLILLGINLMKNSFSDSWDLDCYAADFYDVLESWR